LAGCGGGGGGSSAGGSGYTGVTTQAVVTTSNAKALSADAYSGTQITAAVGTIAKEVTNNSGRPALLQETAGIIERSILTIVSTSKSSAKVADATVQNSVNGYSGSYTFSITYDQTSGDFNGTATFSHYQDTSTSSTISGSIAFNGIYNQVAGTFSSMNSSLNNLTGTDGGKSYNLSGSLNFTNGASQTVTMTVVLTDNVSGHTYWVKDFSLTLSGSLLTVSGTYYNPVYGYVIISTATPLTVTTFDSSPTSGRLLFNGSNGTKARLTFSSGGSTVEADTSGNGTYVNVP
jgi:hypothetical protein